MPSFPLPSKRLFVAGAIGAVVAVVVSADPAGAHHPPEDLVAVEKLARELDAAAAEQSGGLPIWLIVAAMVVVAAGVLMRGHVAVRRPSRRVIALTAIGALIGVPLSTVTSASAATMRLPDLISDEPDPVGGVEINSFTGDDRLILRFDGFVTNVGAGPLEISGDPQLTDEADPDAVHQRAIDTDDLWHVVGTPTVQFETADEHNHFHLMEIGRYSLWNLARTAEVAPAQKDGFCLYDIELAESEDFDGTPDDRAYSQMVTQFCDADDPGSHDLVMGTSAGWRDVYRSGITFQWVDVSATVPGMYWLASEADPYNRVLESDEGNNQIAFAEVTSVVPGYNALPVGAVSTAGAPIEVTLEAETFGAPGALEPVFEIVTAPDHGTLDVSVGTTFAGPTVTYTPDPGYQGCDRFDYLARDSSSAFPLNPTRAAGIIDVGVAGCIVVAISGAPASIIAGTSVDLTPSVGGADPGVTWSVDGVSGGDSALGTISDGGLYIAPDVVPAGGGVTIRATLDADTLVYDEVEIAIEPIPNDAPVMVDPGNLTSTAGNSVTLIIETTDPNGDPFGFTAAGLPDGLTIHPSTGVVTGTPTTPGEHTVRVTADDGKATSVITFDWRVIPGLVDVDLSSWYGPSVMWVVEQGISTGTSPSTFSPDREVTRAEAVTLLWRWVGRPAAAPSQFTDVVAGSYYADAVAWAAEVGVIMGTSATTFEPDSTMTRAQLAAVFHRVAGSPDVFAPSPFGDVPVDRYFTAPIAWMADQELTTGVAPGVFDPFGVVTRAMFATVLCRYSASPASTINGAISGSAVCEPT